MPINNLGEPLENSVKQGKVYLVQTQGIDDRFEGCESFSACTDLVASNEGAYFISLETVASSINSLAS